MVVSEQVRPPLARVYRGNSRNGRGVAAIEAEFKTDLGNDFDHFFSEQMQRAKMAGRNEITFLDIGSGEDGSLIIDSLSYLSSLPKTRNFLAKNREFKVLMVGLTDAPRPELHLKARPIVPSEPWDDDRNRVINERIYARNVYYSLTRAQTLEEFLRAQQIGVIDLVFSNQSLRYLSVNVFGEVVDSIVKKMMPGGKFVAVGFHENLPGFLQSMSTGARSKRFDVRGLNFDEPTLKGMLKLASRDTTGFIGYEGLGSLEDEWMALFKAWDLFKRLGVLTDQDLQEAGMSTGLEGKKRVADRKLLDTLRDRTIHPAITRLIIRKEGEMLQRKCAILAGLQGVKLQYFGRVNEFNSPPDSPPGPVGFLIQKL